MDPAKKDNLLENQKENYKTMDIAKKDALLEKQKKNTKQWIQLINRNF